MIGRSVRPHDARGYGKFTTASLTKILDEYFFKRRCHIKSRLLQQRLRARGKLLCRPSGCGDYKPTAPGWTRSAAEVRSAPIFREKGCSLSPAHIKVDPARDKRRPPIKQNRDDERGSVTYPAPTTDNGWMLAEIARSHEVTSQVQLCLRAGASILAARSAAADPLQPQPQLQLQLQP